MAEQEQEQELLFMQVVMMFQGMAMQNLGKVMNPMTNKIERNLDYAKNFIDILGMLEAKTKGNLNRNESKMLEHILYELRMNYVDEIKKKPAQDGAQSETEEAPQNPGDAPDASEAES